MRALVAVLILVLAAAPVLAREASHHRHKRGKLEDATITNVDRGGTPCRPDDVALDRKIGSICRGC